MALSRQAKLRLREHVIRELSAIGGQASGGYMTIHCAWHHDRNPSLGVNIGENFPGTFKCWSCSEGHGGWNKLAAKLGLAPFDFKGEEAEEKPRISPLMAREIGEAQEDSVAKVGIVTEEPWQAGWKYRGIRSENLTSPESPLAKLFKPSLVRLWIGSKGKVHQERYSRLCLHYAQHQIFLRLSSEQEQRVYNSSGLSLKDPRLPPFGLASFSLPKKQAGLILVEGPYDLMRTVQNLEDLGVGGDFTVIALLGVSHWGSFLGKLELRLLPQLRDTPLILAFDNDRAGRDLSAQVRQDCRSRLLLSKEQVLLLQYDAPDPGDLDKEGMRRALRGLGY